LAAAGLAAAALLGACGNPSSTKSPSPPAESAANLLMGRTGLGGTPAPGFTLTNQFGQSVSLQSLRGKAVVLAFTDSECTTICPLTTASMVQAMHMLGPAAKDVALVGIDANPTATSVQDVYTYSKAHGILHRWQFLTGSLAQLHSVWRAYHIEVAIIHGNIDHTPALYLIDPQGRERYLYLTNGLYGAVSAESHILAYDIARVLPKGAAKVPAPPAPPASYLSSPQKPVVLSSLLPGGTPMTLGPGSAHVVVFFASWVPGVQSELSALSAYQQWAAANGAPTVVAIDEEVTEPSLAAARQSIAGLHLSFPVLVDKTGSVADTYRVKDLAWIALYSAEGKIIDAHDGWVAEEALIQQVQKDFYLGG
jgi:cytochrome oxidase Cu insertion factor (SCO1/SenC/PrrC family)/thiol-disulfide isomerase/thioredoxin